MSVTVHDPRACRLGEGPLWHPERRQLFWFDILGKRLLSREGTDQREWQFDEHVSAAGWVDEDRLLIASEIALFLFDLETGTRRDLVSLEADNPVTRSNDGRADPWGGFWIGTMGRNAEEKSGAIYRYYRGELRCLFDGITISNAICFSPDRATAYFTDTRSRQIMRQPLGKDGWPEGEPAVFVDLTGEGLNPDGAVVDAEGCLWNAQWGAARVARYGPDGRFLSAIPFPVRQMTCPAFGGDGLRRLFATSATQGLSEKATADGQTFATEVDVAGQAEHRVLVDEA
ncbi:MULTISPECIES: SMP-30/gluconolactonase/LRE family protein [unclassified Sulfitobacter]|uniref:SMP-30/gluconolactonase/LRE family protein n=1 Tax=unclassified Sulfitobacter TaxID=196795 RepID=UPI0007C22B22|nr:MULTISPECIES: SMP-30/gluconolactonase/LRE family protein [unclassified Sulfitobacter]KZX95957.1 gluconolactonase [Sulfitobacter sp. HI0023]KZY24152.1 gluconolactonase [Sulfitobacter sp. HI0040]KZZ69270.1 gluconolactonase [Sulfitobacter sp. HI0129]